MTKVPWGPLRRLMLGDDVDSFRCGRHEIDRFLQKYALVNDQRGLSKTFVLPRPVDDDSFPTIIGFHAISMSNVVETGHMERVLKGSLPRYATPTALIGQMASHEKCRGLGIGEHVLMDALTRIKKLNEEIGVAAVITDAIDGRAEAFYVNHGFTILDPSKKVYPRRLALAVASIP